MMAARCRWMGLTLPSSLMARLFGGMRHGRFGDQARQELDHERALFLVQRVPQAGFGTGWIQEVQGELHDGPPLRQAVTGAPPTGGGDAEEHRREPERAANRSARRG